MPCIPQVLDTVAAMQQQSAAYDCRTTIHKSANTNTNVSAMDSWLAEWYYQTVVHDHTAEMALDFWDRSCGLLPCSSDEEYARAAATCLALAIKVHETTTDDDDDETVTAAALLRTMPFRTSPQGQTSSARQDETQPLDPVMIDLERRILHVLEWRLNPPTVSAYVDQLLTLLFWSSHHDHDDHDDHDNDDNHTDDYTINDDSLVVTSARQRRQARELCHYQAYLWASCCKNNRDYHHHHCYHSKNSILVALAIVLNALESVGVAGQDLEDVEFIVTTHCWTDPIDHCYSHDHDCDDGPAQNATTTTTTTTTQSNMPQQLDDLILDLRYQLYHAAQAQSQPNDHHHNDDHDDKASNDKTTVVWGNASPRTPRELLQRDAVHF